MRDIENELLVVLLSRVTIEVVVIVDADAVVHYLVSLACHEIVLQTQV